MCLFPPVQEAQDLWGGGGPVITGYVPSLIGVRGDTLRRGPEWDAAIKDALHKGTWAPRYTLTHLLFYS